ncbi:unnamed protein product [Penicillium roqueforti FM164]|uniref:Uncharacterized protein n=2 Tax=Penicillium roqueforti TaxID=5082 RepID=W6R5E5_PENRF|nr:unnamed protein product [Penicillium roqueforti FM164]
MMNSPPSSSESAPFNDPNDQVEELDSDKHYHHPVWPKRWHHPDFTKEASENWEKEPWYRSTTDRITHRFLTKQFPYHFPWGYIIYRTVYTPESEELWPIAKEKLIRVMHEWMKGELHHETRYGNDPRPEQLIEESHKDVIISDPGRWDGASIEQVRAHFAQYLRKIKQEEHCDDSRFAVCLMIDERSLNSLVKTDDPHGGFVGVVDGRYDTAKRYDSPLYRGFMRSLVCALWPLYLNLQFDQMEQLCPKVPDGWIPVYDEGDGTAQDQDGNFIPKNFGRRRPVRSAQQGCGRG